MHTNKPKILITGGLGYIGSNVAVTYIQAGYEVIILDNISNTYLYVLGKIMEITNIKPNFYDVDLTDTKELEKIIEENQDIEGVIHCANKKSIEESCQEPFLYYQNNINGTINLLKCMEKYQIKNLILTSSGTVYDTTKSLPPLSELDHTNPANPYATTALITERIVQDMASYKGFNIVVMRVFDPIGAHHSAILGDSIKGISPNIVSYLLRVANGELDTFKIYGADYQTKDSTIVRDYIHITDVAEAYLLAIQYIKEFIAYQSENIGSNKKGLFDVFNISLGNGTSIKEMMYLVQEVTEIKIPYKIVKRKDGFVDTLIGNAQKAKQVLGRTPKRTIYQAIEDSWKYEKKEKTFK